MRQGSRLSGEERRTAIVEAVLPLFAKKGFHGATTRELAGAAGVSEALLYRHFPSKELLYEEIQRRCSQEPGPDPALDRLRAMPAGAARLVAAVYVFMHRIGTRRDATFPRLLATSLLEDGRFARMLLKSLMGQWIALFQEALEETRRSGDADRAEGDGSEGFWFCHHLAMALIFLRLPGRQSVEYGASHDEMIDGAVRFCLRGLGVRQEAITSCWSPERFKALAGKGSQSWTAILADGRDT